VRSHLTIDVLSKRISPSPAVRKILRGNHPPPILIALFYVATNAALPVPNSTWTRIGVAPAVLRGLDEHTRPNPSLPERPLILSFVLRHLLARGVLFYQRKRTERGVSRRWKVSGDSTGSCFFASLDSHSIGSCTGWAHEGEEAGPWLSGRLPLAEHIDAFHSLCCDA